MDRCIGIIGLGRMGSAIARWLQSKGYNLVVWNRTPSKVSLLENVEAAGSPREVADKCGEVHIVVADDEASRSVLRGSRGVFSSKRRDLIVVNHSTVTPMHSIEASDYAYRELGADYIEAPVIGGPKEARVGRLLVLAAGPRKGYERVLGVLRDMAREVVYLGDIPAASVVKLAVNSMFFVSAQILSEAIALTKAWEIDPSVLADIASKTWLKPVIDHYYDRILSPETPVGFTVRLATKDLLYAELSGYAKDTPLPLVTMTMQTFMNAVKAGYGEHDYSRVGTYIMGRKPDDSL